MDSITEFECEDWQLVPDKAPNPSSLVVQLRRYVYVLPWFRFVHAEGDNSLARLLWVTHQCIVKGHGLTQLLAALATHRVMRLVEPSQLESRFVSKITSIEVMCIEELKREAKQRAEEEGDDSEYE
jgi:hypothetical protein